MTEHATAEQLARYQQGADLDGEQEWALEAHLEQCAGCRARMAADELVTTVWQGLAPELGAQPRQARRKPLGTWSLPGMLSWAAAAMFVAVIAVLIDAIVPGDALFVVAPLLPVAGVFAASGRGFDAAFEVVSATPRAGLDLLLRRTAVVLGGVVPVMLLAGPVAGIGAAVALLPSFALTMGSLALGSFLGVRRSAALLAGAWVAAVLAIRLVSGGMSWLAAPAAAAAWAVLVVAGAVTVAARRAAFGRTPLIKF
jgi:hypothetical protein